MPSTDTKTQAAPAKKADKGRVEKRKFDYKFTPLYLYKFKDMIRELISHPNFPDALISIFALLSVSIALPFYPALILAILVIGTFVAVMMQPLIGLMVLLFESLLIMMYQAPLLAWLFTIFMSVAFFLGYKHYRTISFIYALMILPFSFLGYLLEIPTFVITILTVGFKRGAIAAIAAVLLVVIISGITGLQNSGAIVYLPQSNLAGAATIGISGLLTPSHAAPSIYTFFSTIPDALSQFFSLNVIEKIFSTFDIILAPLFNSLIPTTIQVITWVFVAFTISNFAVNSRSKYRGSESSLFAVLIPAVYYGISYLTNLVYSNLILISFVTTPVLLFALEAEDINVVRALEVMKQDFRSNFGEAFEDLTTGSTETLDDVVNYDETKKELKEAILAPIEKRELAGAYNIKTAKGILLFGPPGTGKTYIMRALANEIRAGFFYIKTSQILSAYPGATAQTISKVFAIAKKHPPAIMFIDEIDSIAGSRELLESETGRQTLSALLAEMDGFQKVDGVVIVGATNLPQMLDPSIMRPGRFDKIIYMPLPDSVGRRKIFKYYFKDLPISDDIDYEKLAEISDRYSGADIKNISEEVARHVADEAATKNKVLKIGMADIVRIIKATKPSTSLAQVDTYNTFKMDYERRSHQEKINDDGKTKLQEVIGLDDAKKALYEAVELPIMHPELIKKYDVATIKGILLFGPPGTGKTMLMRSVIGSMDNLHTIMLSGSELSKSGPDLALNVIKQAFDRAKENAPAVIFIDEIDGIFPSRDSSNNADVKITGEFLQMLDGIKEAYRIVVIAATNRPDALDPAILRAGRFDKIIYAAPPNKSARAKLFEVKLKKAPIANLDYDKLAEVSQGFTGADITNICMQAKLGALEKSLEEHKDVLIGMDELLKAISKTRPSATAVSLTRYLNFMATYGQR